MATSKHRLDTSRRRPKGTGSVQALRGGRFRLRIFLGPDPVTGRPRQASKTVRAKNATAAQAELEEFRRSVASSPTGSSATVQAAVEEWLRHSAVRGRSPRTIHAARSAAENAIYPELGAIPLKDLTPRHLDEWYRKLLTGEGRRYRTSTQEANTTAGALPPRRLSPATVRRHHAVLSAALSQAVRWGWIEHNPAARATPPELPRNELQVPTSAEVRKLLAAARSRRPEWGVLVALALVTGARRGELCALRWNDVEGGTVRISRSVYRAGSERGEKSTKGGRSRRIPLGEVGRTLLVDWRAVAEERAREAGVVLVDDSFVVSPLPDGSRPINPDTLSSVVHRLAQDLDLPHVHLHSLRHYAATELIGGGVSPRDAADILGHADPALTLRTYAHATVDRQHRASEILDHCIG